MRLLSFLLPALALAYLAGGLGSASAQDGTGAAGDSGQIQLQNTPVNSVLDTYEQLSGKRLIRDNGLQQIPNISVNATGLSKAEALKMIEQALLLNSVALIPIDDHTMKAVAVPQQQKNPRSEGVPLYANAADLPKGEQIVSYYMPLSFISPVEAQQIFQSTVPFHGYGIYQPAQSAQAIILTDNVSSIRELIALKELVDVPPAHVSSEMIKLNRADAEKTAELLSKLLSDQSSGGIPGAAPGPGNPSGAFVPAQVGNDKPLENEHNLISGSAKILPDTRTNSLIVVTRPVNLPFLKQLIAQMDQADLSQIPQRRSLKYVQAKDILPALEEALAQGKEELDKAKTDAGSTANNNPNSSRTASASSNSSGSLGSGSSGSSSGINSVTSPLQAPSENNVPTVVTIGKSKILGDNRSNSIIVFGSPDVVSRVFEMVDELDRRPLQVYLATVIGQLTVSNDQEFGIDLLQKFQNGHAGGVASSSISTANGTVAANVVSPAHLTTASAFPLISGLTVYGAIGSTIDAYVRALLSTDRFKIISRPSVYTSNNKLAVIASGSQIPVPENTVSGYTGNNNNLTTQSSTGYVNVLLDLEIIPLINANHEVTLQIRQTNNQQTGTSTISGNPIPIISTQEINTEITVADKSTVVIGGLITDSNDHKVNGVPFLSDIPVLGYFFKDTQNNKERKELIILIQPTVIETAADQIASDEAEKKRTILGREASAAASGTEFNSEPGSLMPLPKASGGPGTTTSTPEAHTSTYNSKLGSNTTTTTTTSSSTPTLQPVAPAPATPKPASPATPTSTLP